MHSQMNTRIVSFLLLLPTVAAFRPPENAQKDVFLPIISPPLSKTALPQVAPQEAMKPLNAIGRTKWGVDKQYDTDYWYHPSIHTLGNSGFGGGLHAALAPMSTKIIDVLAYEGISIREKVARELSEQIKTGSATRVVDLCCGVGISTRALRKAFPQAETVMGVDTSCEMISMAKFLSKHLAFVSPLVHSFSSNTEQPAVCSTSFTRANAENTKLPSRSFDLVTVMYAFHEAPNHGRHKILKEAHRLLQPGGTLAVIDISTEYTPSRSMLAGEPYVLEYQKNIHSQLRSFKGFARVTYKTVVPNHVGMWIMKRATI